MHVRTVRKLADLYYFCTLYNGTVMLYSHISPLHNCLFSSQFLYMHMYVYMFLLSDCECVKGCHSHFCSNETELHVSAATEGPSRGGVCVCMCGYVCACVWVWV